jgi:hypothetical protein
LSETETENEVVARWNKEAKANTTPLFMQDHFLSTGHDANTKNATGTFVKFKDRFYVCTCRHVVEIVERRQQAKHSRLPTLAMMVGRSVMNLSFVSAQGLKLGIQSVPASRGGPTVDLAIADITASYWDFLTQKAEKKSIDLDDWREPRWAKAQMLVAAGYADEHKYDMTVDFDEKLAAPLLFISADKDGDIARDKPLIQMKGRTEKPHGYFFSGISGGAMYVTQDNLLIGAGIVFEGWPQSNRSAPHATLDDKDIIVRGMTLFLWSWSMIMNKICTSIRNSRSGVSSLTGGLSAGGPSTTLS